MSAFDETLRSLTDVLGQLNLRWMVFGAQAVSIRAAPRATQDVDITVEFDVRNAGPLRDALESAGFAHKGQIEIDAASVRQLRLDRRWWHISTPPIRVPGRGTKSTRKEGTVSGLQDSRR